VRARLVAYAALLVGGVLALVAGGQGAGLSRPLAGAALAGALLMLALRVRGRQVVGGAVALLGLGIAAAGATAALAEPDPWRTAYAVAGALVTAGGVVTLLTSPRWPSRVERFENPDEPVDLWRAQDAGLDPTADAMPPLDPDVRKGPVRDRMS
jgi:MFS family permease